jgi:hypothetical protein
MERTQSVIGKFVKDAKLNPIYASQNTLKIKINMPKTMKLKMHNTQDLGRNSPYKTLSSHK